MAREFKQLQFTNLKGESSGRIRVGIAAVHGNIDSYADRSHLGCFSKTIAEGRSRVRHLWNHNAQQPPIASIVDLKEVGRDELPPEILAKFPNATGGLKVWREYLNQPLSDWVLECVDKDIINEMSYAYDVVKADWTEEENESGQKMQIRELREVRLFDTSDVNYGANPATLGNIKNFGDILPLGTLYQQILTHIEESKAGRRNSASDQTLIQEMHKSLVVLGATCDEKQAETDGEKTADEPETKEAEAVETDTSLDADWFEMQKRKLQILQF